MQKDKTKLQKESVLAAFAESGNVSKACRKAKMTRTTFYEWLQKDKKFKKDYDRVLKVAVGLMEDEAKRRALDGVLEPVFYKGEKVGSIRKYSDTLLIVLLKAHAPEKYRERVSTEISGPDGKPIQTEQIITTTLDL